MADGVCSVGAAVVHAIAGCRGALSIAASAMRVPDAPLNG
jgi:hypothetical protein